ncbi:MAG: polysaccharide deacetylase family protein [Clostridia bacterium]|nr:polysaccharide deacetylase family protein [Clostridia bacterium]
MCLKFYSLYMGEGFIAAVTGKRTLKPVYSVEMEDKKVALSFDACWGAERTEKILDILDKYKVKTTFFLVNIWLEDYPDKAKEVAERGHEIGLHSTTHPHFTTLPVEEMKKELKDNYDMVEKTTGYKAKLFRPPFGDYNNTVIETAGDMGITTIQWSIDSLDWKDLSAQEIANRILSRADKGAIILMHNDGKHTPESLEIIIPKLKAEGYSIVPISDLIHQENWYVDINGIQRKK